MNFPFKTILVGCAIALAGVEQASAQSAEVFGGFTVSALKSDGSHTGTHGWNTTITTYPSSRFGITADFAGYYGDAPVTAVNGADPADRIHQYSFMAGPQFRLVRTD